MTEDINMDNFNFYSPTEFVLGKGRAAETGYFVKKFGGFMELDRNDVTGIYRIAAHASL